MSVLEDEETQEDPTAHEDLALCWLTVDGRVFGIDTRQICEVLGPRIVQAVPLAPSFLAGVLAYRGEVLSAVSLRCVLGLPPEKQNGTVLVLDGGGVPFGLIVDRVGGVVEVEPNTRAANPSTLDLRSRMLFRGAYRTPEGLLVQLDADRLRPEQLIESGLFKSEASAGGVQ